MEMKAIDKRDHFQYHRGWWSVGIAFREHCGDQLGAWLKRAEAELSAAEQREREEHQRERDLSFWCDRHQKHECTQAAEWSWNKEHCHNKPVYGGKCRRHGGVPVEPPSTIGNWGLYGAFYPGGYLGKATDDLIADVAAKTRLEVTRELLGTVFALGDGTSVTWGLATIEQHEQRIAMLSANAAGVVETASRHAAAVRMIRDAGAACLADLAAA